MKKNKIEKLPYIEEKSFEPTPEFAEFLRKTKEDIKAGRNLISFDTMDEAIAHLDKRAKKGKRK